MDQALDSKTDPLTPAVAEALVTQARELLVASEAGEGFPKHYFDALQRDPDVVLAHAQAAKFFHRKPRNGDEPPSGRSQREGFVATKA
jgi:hypothetical protein